MVLSPRELVLVMVDAVVLVSVGDQRVVNAEAVGVNRGALKNLPPYDRHDCLLGAVLDDGHTDDAVAFEQSDHRSLSAGTTPSFSPDATRTEVAFVDLDFTRKRDALRFRMFDHAEAQTGVNPLDGLSAQRTKFGRRAGRDIGAKAPEETPKNGFGKMRVVYVSVFHCTYQALAPIWLN